MSRESPLVCNVLQAVLDGDLHWNQCREGYSLEVLDETIELVRRHGVAPSVLLCSRTRFHLLRSHLDQSEFGVCSSRYKGIQIAVWDAVHPDYVYVLLDEWPLQPEHVAVMVWRRPVTVP